MFGNTINFNYSLLETISYAIKPEHLINIKNMQSLRIMTSSEFSSSQRTAELCKRYEEEKNLLISQFKVLGHEVYSFDRNFLISAFDGSNFK